MELKQNPEGTSFLQGAQVWKNYFFVRLKPESSTLTPTAIRISGHR
jgi:hypothetical protein